MSMQSFLEKLEPSDRELIGKRFSVRSYERNEIVITQIEESYDVFFVLEGRARATIYSEDGKVVDYRDIVPGAIFGELSAIDRTPRSASVIVLEDAKIACLPYQAFREMVEEHPSVAWALMVHLSTTIRSLTERIFEFSTLFVRERLVRELLRLAEPPDEENLVERAIINPAPTHFDLAARIGTHREAVSREMSALAKQGLIEKQKRSLILHNVEALEDLCMRQH